ncbi:MAG TPA: N-6 DNA methylase [Pirellulaceae bacterium]|nr:N-6 DNA methylase [Pirellulaceae bacterium]
MADDQQGLFTPIEPERNGNGRKLQRLFVPKLLREAADNRMLRGAAFDKAHAILIKWAELESSGKLRTRNESQVKGEFLSEVFGEALGYSLFSQGLQSWNFDPEYEVGGQTADGAIGFFPLDPGTAPRVLVEIKGPRINVDRDRSNGRTPVRQLFDYLIELPACPWGIVCNCVSFRLYHREKTTRVYEQYTLQELRDEKKFREFYCLFERGAFLPLLAGQQPRADSLLVQSAQAQREVGGKLYALYHDQRIALIRHLRRPPHGLELNQAIHAAQKLLDRIIFIAFCEDRRLLPPKSIERTWNSIRAFELDENPRWRSFLQLFKSVDRGNRRELVSAFNGELFKENLVDKLELNDDWTNFFREIAGYDFQDEVNVDVLGRLFEQSITDLEEFRKSPDEPAALPAQSKPGRRKREGVYYTPPYITKFIVKHTLGPTLNDRYAALAKELRLDLGTPPARRTGKTWARFHHGQLDILKRLRVCDPACGSGAFLIEAFEFLEDEYEKVIEDLIALEELKESALDGVSATILQENLFGVDLSPEAVEITKLALWIRTAEINKPLSNLSGNIRCGNSVVDDPAVDERAFNWAAQFPQVFAEGKFDCVIGNPPYVRQEWIAAYKPHWEKAFRAFDSVADTFVYFFERGVQLLRDGGRLGFITSGSWVRGNFGGPLRKFFADNASLESMIDFGEFQPFEDAEMIRPSITIVRKSKQTGELRLFKWLTSGKPPENLSECIANAPTMRTDHLGGNAWELESDESLALRGKLATMGGPLGGLDGTRILYGIKTGLAEAYVVDEIAKNQLIADDKNSRDMLWPSVDGTNMRPWHIDDSGEYLLAIRSSNDFAWPWAGATNAEKKFQRCYPAVYAHLSKYRDQLIKRSDQGRYWWELRSCSYWDEFKKPKIVWPDITNRPRFSIDARGLVFGDTAFMIPGANYYLLGLLNSWTTWFFISKTAQPLRLRSDRWQYRLKTQYLEQIPIPRNVRKPTRDAIGRLAEKCCKSASRRYELQTNVQRRLIQTVGTNLLGEPEGELNTKAQQWWTLSLNELGSALKSSFKLKSNPFSSPKTADEWEPYLAKHRREVERLSRELADAEAEINDCVYRLFQLTPDEIKLLQREVEH